MTTINTINYSQLIQEMYVSRKWKLIKDFENLSLVQLNQIIDETFDSLKKDIDFDIKEFNTLCIFIKANILYDPIEILMDMYQSNNWSPHKSLLSLSNSQLNELFLNQLVVLLDKKIEFDNKKFNNMCLYIKSHILDDAFVK